MQLDTQALMQWERCKGELRALLIAYKGAPSYDEDDEQEIRNSVENMIDEVDNLVEGEDE